MERNIILGVLGAALLAFAGAMLLPGRVPDANPKVPWKVAVNAQGHTEVLGLTLNQSTLADAEQCFGDQSTLTLFVTPERGFVIEAFFEQLFLSGLRADIVLGLGAEPGMMDAIYARGLRISQMGSGEKKVSLTPEDIKQVAHFPINSLTYLPKARLEFDLLQQRFGTAAEELVDAKGLKHLLYPDRGMAISRDIQGRVVIQYVDPAEFSRLRSPLFETPPAG